MTTDIVAIYDAHARGLTRRLDSVPTEVLLAALADLIPPPPVRVLDVGAGSGRDAAWFAARGDTVTAAEPAAAFHPIIAARAPDVAIVDARLPDLDGIAGVFDLVLVNAVVQHLDADQRGVAARRLAALTAPQGRLILSLRQGPGAEGKPLFALDPEDEIARLGAAGFALVRRIDTPASRAEEIAEGIGWVWLVMDRNR